MKKLRIAIWHNLPSGGGKRQLYNHVKGLLQRGHHLESWCPDTADQKYLPLGGLLKEHVVPLKGTNDLFHSPVRPARVTRQLVEAMEEQCRTCADAINGGEFDILFGNACMFLRTTPIARFVNLPSAICLHEPFRWFYEAMPELPWIAPPADSGGKLSFRSLRKRFGASSALNSIRIQARAELEYAREFDVILANSIFSRENILRTYNLESKVCYLGVDTEYYKPTGEPKEAFVVGVGTIYHAKGIDRAIRAVAAVERSKRPALVWVGNGASQSDLDEYTLLARRLGVTFTPQIHVPDSEVVSLLSRATAIVYTSRLEPFGLAPLEANACGTPAVAIAEGGIKETIRNGVNGFLASEDDPEVLGELIRRFIDDPQLVARMGAQARQYVQTEWSFDRCTDNIESRLVALSDEKRARTLLNDKRMLLQLRPTQNIRWSVDRSIVSKGAIDMEGWAYIDDGRHATGADIFILARNESDAQLIKADKVVRRDVTEHFASDVDYDASGFAVRARVNLREPYHVGILIVRSTETALQLL